jgi:glycosyltransferase involved in cell wall biosynthesis
MNHGAAASRNLGIIKATCEYIAFLDADDHYLTGRFKADKKIFLSNASIEGVYNTCLGFALDEEGHTKMADDNFGLLAMKERFKPDELFENIGPIGDGGFFSLDTLTVKKNVFSKTGLMDPALRLSQDTDITIKLAALCSLVPGNLSTPVALYGVHKNNRSHNNDLLTTNRPYLFYNLYKWGRAKQLAKSRIFILWERFYQYNLIVNKPTRKQQLFLLFKEGFKNPGLFGSRFFLKQLPFLYRVIS